MLGSLNDFGRMGYGVLYTVPAAFLYIFAIGGIPPSASLGPIPFEILAVAFLFGSLYAAFWNHHVGRLVYGEKAGMESVRDSSEANSHIVYFATGVEPSELPGGSSIPKLFQEAVESDSFEIQAFLRFLPAGLFFLYLFTAWIWLSFLLVDGNGTVGAGALWLILSVLLLRDRVVGYLPDYIPSDSIDGISEPEYMRVHRKVAEKLSDDDEPHRLPAAPRSGSLPSNRYRSSESHDEDGV